MKAYKVLDKDMKPIWGNKDFQYEIGMTYEMDKNDLKIWERCFYFFKELKYVADLYSFNTLKNRIFEVEVNGTVLSGEDNDTIQCTNVLTIVKELSQEEVDTILRESIKDITVDNVTDMPLYDKYICIHLNLYLDILVKDEHCDVRKSVAEQGYGLDVLVKDEHWRVRIAVAEQGYGLDILINDENYNVRRAVARHGYRLDVLVKDNSRFVRVAVAEQGYGLDVLIKDDDWGVRVAVAEQGYGLDILVKDNSRFVYNTALKMLEKENTNESL